VVATRSATMADSLPSDASVDGCHMLGEQWGRGAIVQVPSDTHRGFSRC